MKRKLYNAPVISFAKLLSQDFIMVSTDNDGIYKPEWEDLL